MRWIALTLGLLLAAPASADSVPPWADASISLKSYGIYCAPPVIQQETAPDTDQGFIKVFATTPEIRFQQQKIPGKLGVTFGVVAQARDARDSVRIEVWKPGVSRPESWASAMSTGRATYNGFTFETSEEIVLGSWRIEAWEGEKQLYTVEFDIVPPSTLPGVYSDCALLS